jgi:hypothetical protein
MTDTRTNAALARLEAALARVDRARAASAGTTPPSRDKERGNATRVMALVNSHEKLREEVADTLRDLDTLIADLEERTTDA